MTLLSQHIRSLELLLNLKRAILEQLTSYYQFCYLCKRYGYGATFCEVVGLNLK
ncbi:hypothetical protein DSO57_1012811 [Entomophthora muscae]|uniref:Uncharacterized protein n=1 Tax=Entomophthora muscae TaxID=34485 RepID=A0ACC2URL1_9FUNG|nr:hypothetical protein DSO57_1012811 [Entomophthora muscae]